MRLFYDEDSSRTRAEVQLLGADSLAIAAVALYSTGALRGAASTADLALFLTWACVPRAVAKLLGRWERPTASLRLFGASLLLVGSACFLILAGVDLMASLAPRARPVPEAVMAVLFAIWGTGFFLFQPRAYRLHDVLLLSGIVLGIKEDMPYFPAFLPVFFLGFYESLGLRHVLHDPPLHSPRTRPNLQNVRVLSCLAAALTAAIVAGSYVPLKAGMDFLGLRKPARDERRSPQLRALLQEGAEAADPAEVSGAEGGPPGEDAAGGKSRGRGKVVGFSYQVGLRDLALARFDPREVLRARPLEGSLRPWRPVPHTLWKVTSFSTFDPVKETWEEESKCVTEIWPAGGKLQAGSPPGGRSNSAITAPAVTLRQTVVTPVFRSIVLPYVTLEIHAEGFAMCQIDSSWNIIPSPSLARGTTYDAVVSPLAADSLPGAPSAGAHPEPRYLALPRRADLGVDLRRLGSAVFPEGRRSIQEKIGLLKAHFSRGFRFSHKALWRSGKKHLAAFLTEEKVGDCTYFSTASALLLRAGGVSTRLAAGFLGGQWDASKQEAVIRNQDAHAWVEVYFPGEGWFPVDPTAWVPLDPSYRPPPDASQVIEEAAAALGAAPSGPIPEAELPGDLPPSSAEGYDSSASQASLAMSDAAPSSRRSPEDLSQLGDEGLEGATESWSWLQYEGIVPGTVASSRDFHGSGAFGSGSLPSSLDRLDAPGRDPSGPEAEESLPRASGWRALSRALLSAMAIVVAPLVFISFLPQRRRKKGAGGEEEDGEETIPGASGIAFEELDEIAPRTARDRVLAEYRSLQVSLRRTRSHRRSHQTPLEHARLVARKSAEAQAAFTEIHRVLYRLVYGGEPVTDEQARVVAASCRRIRKALA